jgi:hypothetical protein
MREKETEQRDRRERECVRERGTDRETQRQKKFETFLL